MSNVQWIVIDDTDPRILYSGTWSSQGQETLNDMGQFGAPFLLTSHGTTTNSRLAFSFNGTQLVVAGSQLVPNDQNSFGGTCTVDGATQPIVYTTNNATNRVALCQFHDLAPAQHTLSLDAVPAGSKTFWFDYLRYLPTPDVPNVNEYVEVLTDNGNLVFDSNWHTEAPESAIQVSTNITNSKMSYTFVGTSIAWFGSYNQSASLHPANLSYIIDQQNPVAVEILPSTKARDDITVEQVIFNASGLSPGITHDLKVTYLGNPQSVPLALNNLVITWGPLRGSSSNSSGSTPSFSGTPLLPLQTNNPSNTPPTSGHRSPRVVRIALAVSIVGAAFIIASIVLFITRRRRQRVLASKTDPDVSPRPFVVPNATRFSRRQAHLRTSEPTGIVTTSKARITPPESDDAQSPLPPSSSTETTGPSTSNPDASPTDRDAATYLWNLLLRHQRALSVQPIHHEGGAANSRAEGDSTHPPAYSM